MKVIGNLSLRNSIRNVWCPILVNPKDYDFVNVHLKKRTVEKISAILEEYEDIKLTELIDALVDDKPTITIKIQLIRSQKSTVNRKEAQIKPRLSNAAQTLKY